jgi:CRP-like cAMP-binding protein
MPHRGLPGVTRYGGIGNRLLAALAAADLGLLEPALETFALDQDAVLSRAGDRIEHVFFPHSGAISLMIGMADGQTVATAALGREGAVGILSVLGPSPSGVTAVVRAAGTASRIAACRFHAAFNRSPAIRHVVQLHMRAMLIQFQLGAACNALHPVKARMARWLLHLHDHVDNDVLPLTQESLSQILGVRRTTVTSPDAQSARVRCYQILSTRPGRNRSIAARGSCVRMPPRHASRNRGHLRSIV